MASVRGMPRCRTFTAKGEAVWHPSEQLHQGSGDPLIDGWLGVMSPNSLAIVRVVVCLWTMGDTLLFNRRWREEEEVDNSLPC